MGGRDCGQTQPPLVHPRPLAVRRACRCRDLPHALYSNHTIPAPRRVPLCFRNAGNTVVPKETSRLPHGHIETGVPEDGSHLGPPCEHPDWRTNFSYRLVCSVCCCPSWLTALLADDHSGFIVRWSRISVPLKSVAGAFGGATLP